MINLKQLENKDCYQFTVTNNIDEKSASDFVKFLSEKAGNNQKIKLIGLMESFPGFESFTAFTNTMDLKFKAMNVIKKYAIVTDKGWIENIVPLADFLSPNLPIKHFEKVAYDEAVEWLTNEN